MSLLGNITPCIDSVFGSVVVGETFRIWGFREITIVTHCLLRNRFCLDCRLCRIVTERLREKATGFDTYGFFGTANTALNKRPFTATYVF